MDEQLPIDSIWQSEEFGLIIKIKEYENQIQCQCFVMKSDNEKVRNESMIRFSTGTIRGLFKQIENVELVNELYD